MEVIIKEIFSTVSDTKTVIIICTVAILFDMLTGLIKAFKTKKYNSSINRNGIASKMTWFVMIGLGAIVAWVCHTNLLLWLIGFSCVFSEFMSMIENARDCGVELKINEFLEDRDK